MGSENDSESIRYDPEAETYHAQNDWENQESLSETVVRTVAVATDNDPMDIGPLYEAIDPDALDTIFEPRLGTDLRENGGHLTFTLDECTVTIYWDGRIVVSPQEEA